MNSLHNVPLVAVKHKALENERDGPVAVAGLLSKAIRKADSEPARFPKRALNCSWLSAASRDLHHVPK